MPSDPSRLALVSKLSPLRVASVISNAFTASHCLNECYSLSFWNSKKRVPLAVKLGLILTQVFLWHTLIHRLALLPHARSWSKMKTDWKSCLLRHVFRHFEYSCLWLLRFQLRTSYIVLPGSGSHIQGWLMPQEWTQSCGSPGSERVLKRPLRTLKSYVSIPMIEKLWITLNALPIACNNNIKGCRSYHALFQVETHKTPVYEPFFLQGILC